MRASSPASPPPSPDLPPPSPSLAAGLPAPLVDPTFPFSGDVTTEAILVTQSLARASSISTAVFFSATAAMARTKEDIGTGPAPAPTLPAAKPDPLLLLLHCWRRLLHGETWPYCHLHSPCQARATCGGANRRQQLCSAAGKRRRRRRRCLRGALDTPAPLPTPTPRARGGFLPTRRPPCCLPCEKREKEDEGRRGI